MLTRHFTANEIKPAGWLKRQLEIQAAGLSGNLDKMWPDVRDSRWVGGNKEGWERVPYWLDGFIPLAYLLDNEDMKARAQKYIDAIIANQQEDGWICPCTAEERAGYDMWALYLLCKVLTVYYDCTGDERVPDVIYRALKNLKDHIEAHPIFAWAHSRWFECLIPIYFVYARKKEQWLMDLAALLKKQGMDYEGMYADWPYKEPLNQWKQESHVVNQGMAIKAGGLSSVISGTVDDSFSEKMINMLWEYHGTAVGHFTGDECLSGDSPIQGTELCGVAEAMYSYELLYELTGDPIWADRLEILAFNAFPATCSADMWTHQYDQMTNQIACVKFEPSIFRTNSPESNLYGLEPNFGCCTANFNQAWPKFALSAFYRTDDGVAAGAVIPAVLTVEINGVKVKVECETAYPFGNTANYIVTADAPVDFALTVRVPSFADGAVIDGEAADAGTLVSLRRTWEGTSVVSVVYDFSVRFDSRPREMYTLARGPLFYTLDIGEEWTKLEYVRNDVERRFPYCDYEIRPTTPWQYAFVSLDPAAVEVEERGIADLPFSEKEPAIVLKADMVPINWGYKDGYEGAVARMVPLSAVPTGEPVKLTFKPYGASNLHLTEIPKAAE